MKEVLLRKLIEKQYFMAGTEVDAAVKVKEFNGTNRKFRETYTVTRILEKKATKTLLLELSSIVDGTTVRIEPSDIVGIEGMVPERFAENYMLSDDGEEIVITSLRRGRRPKWMTEQEDEEEFEC